MQSGDLGFVLVCAGAVSIMTVPGVTLYTFGTLLNADRVRKQVLYAMAASTLLWVFVGYRLVFGYSSGQIAPQLGSTDGFEIFQLAFCAITPTLLVGVMADRFPNGRAGLFLALWSLFVYCPIAWAVWSPSGILHQVGVLDYAGGLVVHVAAGASALAIVIMTVPGEVLARPTEKHVGAALLCVGWLGFNGGSALAADVHAAQAILNSLVAAAVAGLAWVAVDRAEGDFEDGAIAGLVAITPACGYVDTSSALWIGLVAGAVCRWISTRLTKLGGDPCGVVPVHGVGGVIGSVLTGVFASAAVADLPSPLGLLDGAYWLPIVQLGATIMVASYAFGMTTVLLLGTTILFGGQIELRESGWRAHD